MQPIAGETLATTARRRWPRKLARNAARGAEVSSERRRAGPPPTHRRRSRPDPPASAARAPRRLDRVELGALRRARRPLAASCSPPLLTKGRPLSGADGLLAADQLQYFAWIREAAHHVLIGNRFDLAPGAAPFLHPGFAISGLLHASRALVPLAYLLWKPVAVARHLLRRAALRAPPARRPAGSATRRWCSRCSRSCRRRGSSPGPDWGGNPRQYTFDFISGEMWSGQYLWGYLMTAIAVFLMPLVLLGHRALARDAPRGPPPARCSCAGCSRGRARRWR